tara:strand:+ start:4906 stop:5079 length:174 start_codon:yes stop_codon:yes gene_type:complete
MDKPEFKTKEDYDRYVLLLAKDMARTTMKYVRKAHRRGIAIGFILGLTVSIIVKYIT